MGAIYWSSSTTCLEGDYRSNATFRLSTGFVSGAVLSVEVFEWKALIGDRNCQPGDAERRQFGRRKNHP